MEVEEYLVILENGLVDLKFIILDIEIINDMFRVVYFVKGGAVMLGMYSIKKIVYCLEDCFKIIWENFIDFD